jgi:hypothetical protein
MNASADQFMKIAQLNSVYQFLLICRERTASPQPRIKR